MEHCVMTSTTYANAPDLTAEDYVVIGLAACFIKDDGEIHQVRVAEPIPSAALETLFKGIATSYEQAYATTLGAVLAGDAPQLPADFPAETQFCDDFAERTIAAARTYKNHPTSQALIAPGTAKTDFNFSTERKRVLNSERLVKTEDNVKQHAYTHQVL
ncbi:MAG: hypothetical protein Kow00121_24360 [Elainellaceae cyanobacterium]